MFKPSNRQAAYLHNVQTVKPPSRILKQCSNRQTAKSHIQTTFKPSNRQAAY